MNWIKPVSCGKKRGGISHESVLQALSDLLDVFDSSSPGGDGRGEPHPNPRRLPVSQRHLLPVVRGERSGFAGKIWLRYRNDLRPGRAVDSGPRIGTTGFFDDLRGGLSPGIGGGGGSHTSGELHRQPVNETDGPPVHLKARRPQRE